MDSEEPAALGPAPAARIRPRDYAGILVALLVLLGGCLQWVESPLRGPVSRDLGPLAIVVSLVMVAASLLHRHRILAVSGSVVIALCAIAWLRLAVQDPRLWLLADDNVQRSEILIFCEKELPRNKGADPQLVHAVAIETPGDRLQAALYFMARGWWLTLVGGLLIVATQLLARPLPTLASAAVTALLALAVGVLILRGGLAAELSLAGADRAMAYGRFDEAIRSYDAARRSSAQADSSDDLWLKTGEAYYRLDMKSDMRSRFYVAAGHLAAKDLDGAITEYQPVADGAPEPLRALARRRLAWAYVRKGTALHEQGSPATAVKLWEQALATDPAQLQAAFYLSRGYFEVGRYDASVAIGRSLLRHAGDKQIRADTFCNIGDSLTKLHQFSPAREAYEASWLLDPDMNYRMFRSLGGT